MNARIAIPYADDGTVFPHFGRTTKFKVYTVENDRVTAANVVPAAAGAAHEELALGLLLEQVGIVICGEIGPGALGALTAAGIMAMAGVTGSSDAAVEKLIAGELVSSSNPTCGCTGHCGGRSCGSHCGGGCRH